MRRLLSAGRMVIFYHDFPPTPVETYLKDVPAHVTFERINSQEELAGADLVKIVNFWNPKLAERNLKERFAIGATLWLVRDQDELAGYGWTLTGKTVRPYFVPLGPNDIHLFDFLVFPEFRGRRLNPALVGFILDTLGREGRSRAYIEVAEWNDKELRSLEKTSFHHLGMARRSIFLRRTIVDWRRDPKRMG
jgi:ribosomal protein S18 acetylase RimI-like enzyme